MEEEKVIEQQEVKVEEVVQEEEVKTETKIETKEDKKVDVKEEVDTKFSELELRLKTLEDEKKAMVEEINSQKIKNTILEKIEDKDLQKAVLETGLVKNVDDIEKVMKILELSKSLSKSKFTDGYKPQDVVQGDPYQQAQSKGNVLDMIRQKMNKQ